MKGLFNFNGCKQGTKLDDAKNIRAVLRAFSVQKQLSLRATRLRVFVAFCQKPEKRRGSPRQSDVRGSVYYQRVGLSFPSGSATKSFPFRVAVFAFSLPPSSSPGARLQDMYSERHGLLPSSLCKSLCDQTDRPIRGQAFPQGCTRFSRKKLT